jgi:hypothetical protein
MADKSNITTRNVNGETLKWNKELGAPARSFGRPRNAEKPATATVRKSAPTKIRTTKAAPKASAPTVAPSVPVVAATGTPTK